MITPNKYSYLLNWEGGRLFDVNEANKLKKDLSSISEATVT